MLHEKFLSLLPLLCIPLICPVDSFTRRHGELCDWTSHRETCDESRGLACSYKTHKCTCWDIRNIYSEEKSRCVGKSGEECHSFGGERLCTENAYCLEDESLSPFPVCLCLKGFFKASNGSCIRRSKYGEFCESQSKYPASPLSSQSNGGGATISNVASGSRTSNSNCEPESGLQCVNYKCQCEPNQIYDIKRELCTSLVGMQCSKSLDNCVLNAECSEKIWIFDHITGETKMVGHRCSCRNGLMVTEEGFCAVEYGGNCTTSSECYFGEGLTCINGKCQCHPLSQIYDKRLRRCLNLVGTKCHTQTQELKQDSRHHHPDSNQQESLERARMDLIPKPTSTSSSSNAYASKPVIINTSPFTSTAAAATTYSAGTTATPFIIKSRNVTSRNFYLNNDNNQRSDNYSRSFLFPTHSKPQTGSVHSISPRHYTANANINGYSNHKDQLPAEHRSSTLSTEMLPQCVTHAECLPTSPSPSPSDYYCTCKNGTSETVMRTCLLEHGEPCGHQLSGNSNAGAPGYIECNVFEGLVCLSDTATCQCADPMLIYDTETRACLSTVGNPCGKMKLNPKLLHYEEDMSNGGNQENQHSPTPFYQHYSDQFMYINCVANATCVEKSVNGQFKQVCVTRGKFSLSSNKYGFAS